MILEACIDTIEQAVNAQKFGAHRIELCDDLSVGGVTPPRDMILKAKELIHIPIMTMVRPRGGNFFYSDAEFEQMKADIEMCKELKVDGVVIGMLNEDKTIDIQRTKELVDLAQPLLVTFHKAIDRTNDILTEVAKLKNIKGLQRVLTSGGALTALEGKENLCKMLDIVGNELIILVAGEISYENLDELKTLIPAKEFHGKKIVKEY